MLSKEVMTQVLEHDAKHLKARTVSEIDSLIEELGLAKQRLLSERPDNYYLGTGIITKAAEAVKGGTEFMGKIELLAQLKKGDFDE